ncbi:hypothetical protein TKK_0002160 [Trichogramma kaykai]|uniref:Uncharacterized protein n=1 Tax=Trichogramma kaykai TaxID=54128 RepID=A0ABD2XB25_9HYME
MLQIHEDQVERVNKDVVVIGNGPSGICLSYLLAGNWPHYTCKDHPGDEMLTARLRYSIAASELEHSSAADRSSNCSSVSEEDDEDEEDNDSNDSFSSLPRDDDCDDDRREDEISCRCCQRLQNRHCLPLSMSKPEQLELLASGLEGRNSGKPLSLLMDNLQHPCLDAGLDVPSLLDWKSVQEHREHRPVDHVVLGKGPPGGIWHSLDPSVLTISLTRWMSLPGLDLRDWLASLDQDERRRLQIVPPPPAADNEQSRDKDKVERVPIGVVAAYYRDYVTRHALDKHFRCGSVVTSVKPLRGGGDCCDDHDGNDEYRWLVEGYEYDSGRQFRYRSKRVVLATGTTDSYNRLGCSGEDSYNWVAHDFKAFRRKLERASRGGGSCCQQSQQQSTPEPVLVVGSGLSAADAIMAARSRGVPVVHVFRTSSPSSSSTSSKSKSARSLDKVQWLPASAYPEYHKVYEMMANNRKYPLYTPLADHCVVDFSSACDRLARTKKRKVTLCSPQGRLLTLRVSCAAVLIGSKPDLSYLENNGTDLGKYVDRPIDSHANPINVNVYTYEVEQAARRGLYAVGPLVGDNFVRFILGGAYGVFADILNNQYS